MAESQHGVWGIDLGQCALKAIRLEEIDGEITATAFDYVEHPKILSQPDADAPPASHQGVLAALDIGADGSSLIVTDGEKVLWQRPIPIGGNHFTRVLTKDLKLTFAKAEHLKRNATKAPDPRSIFTAMRGVFNDFASEINRSIGFYSSVNRTAKISKVIGLGNGFKIGRASCRERV